MLKCRPGTGFPVEIRYLDVQSSARRACGGALFVALCLLLLACTRPTPAPGSTSTPGMVDEPTAVLPPLVPPVVTGTVRTPAPDPVVGGAGAAPAPQASHLGTGKAGAQSGASAGRIPIQARDMRSRLGVALAYNEIDDYDWGTALPGWYLSWHVIAEPRQPDGIPYVQMVRVRPQFIEPGLEDVVAAARLNPGSLWLIGNEPDVPLQDNATPLRYVQAYRELYDAIKEADPSAQIAIGGIGQPTPLRMVYLDRILSVYRSLYNTEMPVDVWNIHAFILREERDSWGVGIPPGIEANRGQLYEIEDHDNLAIFRRQILDFRRWMADRGLRDRPLIVSEYGILMPAAYGFGADRVASFMTATFDFFLNARDPDVGYPADDNRLVQAFCWFSVGDKDYPASNLFDPDTRALLPLGRAFQRYVEGLTP